MICQKKFDKRNATLTDQYNDFRKFKNKSPRGAFFRKPWSKLKISNFSRGKNQGTFRGRFGGNTRGFRGPRLNYPQPHWQNQNQSSYTPRQQSYQNFPQQNLNSFFFSRNLPVSNLTIRTLRNKTLIIKTHSLRILILNRNHLSKS